MEVKVKNDGLLTNREVLDLLEERRKTRNVAANGNVQLQDREHVEISTMKYLQSTAMRDTTSETVIACLNAIKRLQFDLTEAEMIQIANHVPINEVEVHLLVEECSVRLDEVQIALLLSTVMETLSATLKMDES